MRESLRVGNRAGESTQFLDRVALEAIRKFQCFATMAASSEEGVSLDKQLRLLGEYAAVVDVGRTEEAAERLSDLLQLGSAHTLGRRPHGSISRCD